MEKTNNKPVREKLGFKNIAGTTLFNFTESITAAFMTSWFMVYLTDYAGIGHWAALLGSALLLFARLFDAVNDPIEGWIMDRAKVGKMGKYKPFIILSILMTSLGVIALFFLPSAFADMPVAICAWVIIFYLIYDIGSSFYAPNLIYRTLTTDSIQRSKLIIGPRLVSMIVGMVGSALISIVNGINQSVNNMHTSFGLAITLLTGVCMVVSLIGIFMVKEKYHAVKEEDEEVKVTDIIKVLKHNKAERVMVVGTIFSGFIWTFLFATMLYYIKWAYCADLATGAVNVDAYAGLSLIGSMMMFLPLIVGTILATPLMRLAKDPMKLHRILMLVEAGAAGLMFVLHIVGVLPTSPALFFGCLAVTATCIGIDYIPQETVNIECMDYELHVGGKDRAATCNAANKFINKAQNALASAMVGAVLVAIGYVVDSATDTYVGELSKLPSLLTWFVVIMGLIPCILGVISYLILRQYPINDEIRAEMKKEVKA